MLASLLAGEVYAFMLVFIRIGAAMSVLPGFGDALVLPRVRLLLALLIAFLVTPIVEPTLPPVPASPIALGLLAFGETLIGLLLGWIARFLLTAVDIAGMIISFSIGLANAQVFNPAFATQGSLIGSFLTVTALVLIFVSDLHHLMLIGVVDSYSLFVPGEIPPMGDVADLAARLVARSFLIGAQLAAPFIFVGLIFFLGIGLLARLMPQVQIFFIAIPIQIFLGTIIMMIVLSAMMLYWLNNFHDGLMAFLLPA